MKNEYFTSVYNKYHRLVLKAVLDQTNDLELAQEVCQTVFLKYYDSYDMVTREFVKGWLLATAKSTIMDSYRKAYAQHEVAMADYKMNALPVYCMDELVEKASHSQLLFSIFEDLKQVNRTWYEVVYEAHVNGRTQEDAAVTLGMKLTVFRSKLCRARRYIRGKYLEEYKRVRQ